MKNDLEKKIDSGDLRIALVGMGYIGTCIGAVLAGRGYPVVGIDVRESVVDEINASGTSVAEPGLGELVRSAVAGKKLSATKDFAAVAQADVVIITVGTPMGENFDPDTSHLFAAANSIKEHLREGQLVILKSTVPPNTTEQVVKPVLDGKGVPYYLSFCPERLAEGRALADFQSIPIVVGGIDPESSELSAQFWKKVLGLDILTVKNARAAELVKLADNLWIDVNIALANEVAMLSDKLGVDALEVIAAANSLPKGKNMVNILFPGIGVGGYCLTKDPWFVHHMGKRFGLDLKAPPASRTTNDAMPEYSFGLVEAAMQKLNKSPQKSKIAVLGLSFKNNTGDCRYSPTKPIVEKLIASGCKLELYDPWVSDHEALLITEKKLNRDMADTLSGADAVLFLAGHDEFKKITVGQLRAAVKSDAVIFDGRNMMSKEMIEGLRNAGFTYKGVGR